LFDLGTRVDWENSVPHIAELLSTGIPGLRVKQDVTEILKDGGLNLNDVKAFILSHWHFDHCMPMLHTDMREHWQRRFANACRWQYFGSAEVYRFDRWSWIQERIFTWLSEQ
jgi:glyoxylase-like metal-dependent hydrolase (beta-lactamase superfamily II)